MANFLRLMIVCLMLSAPVLAVAADTKVGFVNRERILREAAPANRAQVKLEKEMREGPAVSVLATKLDEDYDANLIGADTKYKGKVLEVTGKVKRVDRDGFGRPWLEFETESDAVMKCEFSKEADAALGKVEVNKDITIRGRCKGKSKGRKGEEIVLESCQIVTPVPKAK